MAVAPRPPAARGNSVGACLRVDSHPRIPLPHRFASRLTRIEARTTVGDAEGPKGGSETGRAGSRSLRGSGSLEGSLTRTAPSAGRVIAVFAPSAFHLPRTHTCPPAPTCTAPAVRRRCRCVVRGTLALALPKDTPAQTARCCVGTMCAPTALAQHASAVQVSAVPVGVAGGPSAMLRDASRCQGVPGSAVKGSCLPIPARSTGPRACASTP